MLDFLFPPKCAACDSFISAERVLGFCSQCSRDIHWIKEPICPVCGVSYQAINDEGNSLRKNSRTVVDDKLNHPCGNCIRKIYKFDTARASVVYRGKLKETIKRFKFANMPGLSGSLVKIMTFNPLVKAVVSHADLVMPVPLHKKRLKKRGYNQALLLARDLSREFNIGLEEHNLRRTKHTLPQVGLGKKERRKNVKGAFSITRPERVKGKDVLLVDDVFTTGNTLSECAGELKKSGARTVLAITIARVLATDFD